MKIGRLNDDLGQKPYRKIVDRIDGAPELPDFSLPMAKIWELGRHNPLRDF